MGLVADILVDVERKIAADDDVLNEARARLALVADSAMALPGALRHFASGSLAHRTVNNPVTDADGGVVLDRRKYLTLGPDGDGEGPGEVVDELCEIVGEKVREHYSDARVTQSKRGLKVSFDEPLKEQDPTVDLIVTLTRTEGEGLWIPNLEKNNWDASHPEKHTELFTSGAESVRKLRARLARLTKAWNKQWAKPALSSFNVTSLAWMYMEDHDDDTPIDEALADFFAYVHAEVAERNTPDPAGVSAPIRLLESRETAVKRFASASDQLQRALKNDGDEALVRDVLSTVFRDYVDPPPVSRSALAGVLRHGNAGVSVTTSGVVLGGAAPLKTTRSFGSGRSK